MKRKGIPKKRIGLGDWERSIRMRQFKDTGESLNAAERSALGGMSVSLCGIMEKKKNKNEKEVVKRKKMNEKGPVKNRLKPVPRGKQ